MSPRTQLQRLVEQWPQISADLTTLPDVLHLLVRRAIDESRAPSSEGQARMEPQRARVPWRGATVPALLLGVLGASWLLTALTPVGVGWLALGAGLGLAAASLAVSRD